MATQPIVVGGTYDWFLNPASINTEAAPNVFAIWDITSATVTITFAYYPNGQNNAPTIVNHFSATIVSGPAGKARYINLATLFTAAGTWGVSWKVSNSGTVLESDIQFFIVKTSGAAL